MLFSTLWLLVVVDLTGRLLYKLTISVDRCFAESGIGAAAWTSLRSCWRCPVGMPEERSFCVRLTAVCFRCLRTAFFRPFVVIQYNLRDHLPVVQCFLHLLFQKIEHPAVIRKAHFHFGWMDVDIYLIWCRSADGGMPSEIYAASDRPDSRSPILLRAPGF